MEKYMKVPRRIERDSLGEVLVPINALYGAQTQRAVENFAISGLKGVRARFLVRAQYDLS